MREFVSSRRRWLFLALACIPAGLATRPLKRQIEALGSALGGSFSWGDLGCYGAGIALGALLNKDKKRK